MTFKNIKTNNSAQAAGRSSGSLTTKAVKSCLTDNLFITDSSGNELWCMREAVGRPDTCVLLRQVSEGKFYFLTFNGFSAEVDINTLEVTDKKAHKR